MTVPPAAPSRRLPSWITALPIVLSLAGCNLAERIDPRPFPVATSPERTEGAIRDGLRRNGWEVEDIDPGFVVARYVHEGLPVRVRILYDGDEAEILWVETTDDLGETPEQVERSRKTIRRLIRSLAERIEYFVESADLGSDGPPPPAGPVPNRR